jgi:hypothetical protein
MLQGAFCAPEGVAPRNESALRPDAKRAETKSRCGDAGHLTVLNALHSGAIADQARVRVGVIEKVLARPPLDFIKKIVAVGCRRRIGGHIGPEPLCCCGECAKRKRRFEEAPSRLRLPRKNRTLNHCVLKNYYTAKSVGNPRVVYARRNSC